MESRPSSLAKPDAFESIAVDKRRVDCEEKKQIRFAIVSGQFCDKRLAIALAVCIRHPVELSVFIFPANSSFQWNYQSSLEKSNFNS